MKPEYVQALETRLEWLEWGKTKGTEAWKAINDSGHVLPQFMYTLEHGETFVMDAHFCRLVDHARRTIPDSMEWDPAWLIRPSGWLWMAEPVLLPDLRVTAKLVEATKAVEAAIEPLDKEAAQRVLEQKMAELGIKNVSKLVRWFGAEEGMMIRALGWQSFPAGTTLTRSDGTRYTLATPGTHFVCFQRFADYDWARGRVGFGSWSYFMLSQGDQLGPRIKAFEELTAPNDGAYEPRTMAPLHEMRWVYTAMYMMSQRLAVRVRHDTDRPTRRRAEHRGQQAPPFIEVVTLRRLEAARPRTASEPREWNWQWEVRGHWRNQWYRKERVHKPKFIEAYVKGPADKPFKEHGTKLFVAKR